MFVAKPNGELHNILFSELHKHEKHIKVERRDKQKRTHITLVGDQVQQALLDPQQVRGGRHHHVDQDFWNDGDEGVLPGERIKEGCYCMKDLR